MLDGEFQLAFFKNARTPPSFIENFAAILENRKDGRFTPLMNGGYIDQLIILIGEKNKHSVRWAS